MRSQVGASPRYLLSESSHPVAEVIASSTREILAEVYVEAQVPAFGSWVEIETEDGMVLYGLVSHAETGSVEPGRRAVALGAHYDRDRIRRENASPNLVDVVLDGSFPFTTLIFLFRIDELPRRVLAHRFALFDRDGGPGLWRGAPSIMNHLRLHIEERGGADRIDRLEPDAEGLTWV